MTRRKPSHYTGTFRFDAGESVWLAQVAEIPEVHTYGRTLAKAEANLLDALSLWTEQPPESVRILPNWQLPKSVLNDLSLATQTRDRAMRIEAAAARQTTRACLELRDLGLGQRDIAHLVGLSHQRVQQLLRDWGSADAPPPVPAGQYDPLLDSRDTSGTLPASVKGSSKR